MRGERIGIDRVCFATDGRSRESSKNKPGFQSAHRQKYANPGTREIAGNPRKINVFLDFSLALFRYLWYNSIIKGGEILAADYGKNLFNHNQALTAENDKLKAKVAKIESETAGKYLGVIDRLNETLDAVMLKCAALEERVAKLEAENDRLRKQLGNNSDNSSNPPSTDIKPNAPNEYNGRTKTGKKSGGQRDTKASI